MSGEADMPDTAGTARPVIDVGPRGVGPLTAGRLVLGTMTFGDQLDEPSAATVVHRARELGVTMFDTANRYADGRSEEILGRIVAPFRDEVLLATKVGSGRAAGDGAGGTGGPRIDRASIRREIDGSLRRLGVDHVDLYYLHMPDGVTPLEESLGAMQELIVEGKIRAVGISNHAAWQMVDAHHLARQAGGTAPSVGQPMYNLLARRIEDEYLQCSEHLGLANLVYNPLAGGLLTGKHRGVERPAEGTRFASRRTYRERYWSTDLHAAVDRLAAVAEEAGIPSIALALRWLLMREGVTGVILGVSSPTQLEECISAALGPALDAGTLAACDEVWDALRGSAPAYNR